jgi:enterochelin esterase-like enzyme
MKKTILCLFVCWAVYLEAPAQNRISDLINSLKTAAVIADSAERTTKLSMLWTQLQARGIPFISGDSVAFLYRGEGKNVAWMGDFNGWGYRKDFDNKGVRIPGSNIWYLKSKFPADARLDYKVLLDGARWELDPENPHQQWSGIGGGSPNSELRMPAWKQDPIVKERSGIIRGTVKRDVLFTSKILNYQITYSVYLPAHYEKLGKLPVVYVTDGFEYMHPELGNMTTILDNLIADKKIKPIIAVFVDHREPINRANNKRMHELNMNETYLKFFTDELVPTIEQTYSVIRDAKYRAMLGTSMGGLASAYFVFTRADVFSMAGIQSPAFYVRPQIYSLCDSTGSPAIRVSMTSGTINDTGEGALRMQEILKKTACTYTYRETHQGHSWGNWKCLIDDILIDFFGLP